MKFRGLKSRRVQRRSEVDSLAMAVERRVTYVVCHFLIPVTVRRERHSEREISRDQCKRHSER